MLVHPKANLLPLAAGIKQRVDVPVIAVGRLEPEVADRAIAEGQADFVAMARPLLADPELPKKLAEGRPEDVRPCIYCYACVGQIFVNQSVKCAVNPATAREAEFAISRAASPKNVLVVGAGPAGMEAARVAALRGHRVTLCEKEPRLGGTLYFSSLVWEENGKLVEYLETQIRKLPIDLRLGTEVDAALVQQLAPDVVLLALGGKREAPALPGVEQPHVLNGDELRQLLTGSNSAAEAKLSFGQRTLLKAGHALLGLGDHIERVRELSKYWMPLGERIVIIGGGLVGLELAEFLVERSRQVTVLEEGPHLAAQMAIPRRWRSLHELRTRGVTLHTRVRIHAIDDEGVVVTLSNERETIPADHVILAASVVPNRDILPSIQALGCEVHLIGDCDQLSYIEGSILAAARVARSI
jgi:NADPH-dependent 2,4-dienoyl-CoA reductase/sulfur reductase-like enzyme